MNALTASYVALLSEIKPEVIRDEKQNRAYLRQLERLTSKRSLTRAEEKLIDLLAVLIEDFEAKHYPVPEATPVGIVRHLMEAHGLRQKDLMDIFGTESIVSEVLHGKRELTREHIAKLSVRFGVSPAVFF
jgi:HTH-type transcriptional regulator/antitoxin HigA